MNRLIVTALSLALAVPAAAQKPPAPAQVAAVVGTWKVDPKQVRGRKDAPRLVIVRADSSASWGTETVRWRIRGDRLLLAIGGEWENYRLRLKGRTLTLSEGDLTRPVSFERVGPPTPRAANIAVPADPDRPGA
ncbi:MAG: hypothetical protein H0U85_05240 [Gemmatimonadales bacterium]|nr:hypothetical protein [Gemmatimonadales bacterium]